MSRSSYRKSREVAEALAAANAGFRVRGRTVDRTFEQTVVAIVFMAIAAGLYLSRF